jgi:hypothetical protein
MNVREDDIRRYVEVFHSTLADTAARYLPDRAIELLHSSLLPATVRAFVSTQFGVAFEYVPADQFTIVTTVGSARVEDLLFEAPPAIRRRPAAIAVAGRDNTFANCGVSDLFPLRLTSVAASVTLDGFDAKAGSWVRCIRYAELYGDRSIDRWTIDSAVSRAKDEVLAALVETRRADRRQLTLAEYIKGHKSKTVLVLGAYSQTGAARLDTIAAGLTTLGYNPLLVREVPDQPAQDLRQKVTMLGSLSRFVIIDDTSPSGHLVETVICLDNDWVTIILRPHGIGSSWMAAGASVASKVVLEQAYSPNCLDAVLKPAVEWAEAKVAELQRKFESTYPWRRQKY